MDLLPIAKDSWTIFAYAKEDGECQVAEFLGDESKYGSEKLKMLALLDYVSVNGPKHRDDFSKHLSGKIFEFKRGPKKGPKIRVLYFYDENKIIISTHGFMKRDESPKEKIEDAEKIRVEYLEAKEKGEVNILELED